LSRLVYIGRAVPMLVEGGYPYVGGSRAVLRR